MVLHMSIKGTWKYNLEIKIKLLDRNNMLDKDSHSYHADVNNFLRRSVNVRTRNLYHADEKRTLRMAARKRSVRILIAEATKRPPALIPLAATLSL